MRALTCSVTPTGVFDCTDSPLERDGSAVRINGVEFQVPAFLTGLVDASSGDDGAGPRAVCAVAPADVELDPTSPFRGTGSVLAVSDRAVLLALRHGEGGVIGLRNGAAELVPVYRSGEWIESDAPPIFSGQVRRIFIDPHDDDCEELDKQAVLLRRDGTLVVDDETWEIDERRRRLLEHLPDGDKGILVIVSIEDDDDFDEDDSFDAPGVTLIAMNEDDDEALVFIHDGFDGSISFEEEDDDDEIHEVRVSYDDGDFSFSPDDHEELLEGVTVLTVETDGTVKCGAKAEFDGLDLEVKDETLDLTDDQLTVWRALAAAGCRITILHRGDDEESFDDDHFGDEPRGLVSGSGVIVIGAESGLAVLATVPGASATVAMEDDDDDDCTLTLRHTGDRVTIGKNQAGDGPRGLNLELQGDGFALKLTLAPGGG